jgi:hypothetical protein
VLVAAEDALGLDTYFHSGEWLEVRGEWFDYFRRNTTNNGVVGYVFGDDGPCCYHTMPTDSYTWKDDGISTNPYIVANNHWLGADTLYVDAFRGVFEVVVEGCHCDTLRQIDVIANADRTNDCAVNTDAGVIANGNVANSIVDATIRLDNATPA